VAKDGKEGIDMATRYQPNGILLDVQLPDLNGLIVLDDLKFNLQTRHIPVHVISIDDQNITALNKGASDFNSKPVSEKEIKQNLEKFEKLQNSEVKEILVVEDDKVSLKVIEGLLKNKHLKISTATTGKEGMAKIKNKRFDCIILDLKLPDISGFDLLKKVQGNNSLNNTPVIVYTGKELEKSEIRELNKYTNSIVLKGASSPEHLLDEVSLFIHSGESKLSAKQKKIMAALHDPEQLLAGRKILVVDDDMRNTYALSKTLSDAGMKVVMADNGQMAIDKLQEEEGVDIVLMDVMMPVMDGYEATKAIRKMPEFKNLPIISLTAKAMPEDRAKSLDAGANDYLTKPVDIEKLLSIIRVWLYKVYQLNGI